MALAATTLIVFTSVIVFFVVILLLVSILLGAKTVLTPSGPVKITINGEKEIEVASGSTLLSTLGDNKIFLPSACGGGGTCVQCKCQVLEGGEILPTETPHFTRAEQADKWRLGCQVKVKEDMDIQILRKSLALRSGRLKLYLITMWLPLLRSLLLRFLKTWITRRVDIYR